MSSKSDRKRSPEKKGPAKTADKGLFGLPKERTQFKSLKLSNPNFFGNLADSPFKPVKVISSNASFEELMCVGFNPQLDQLEAVVFIKQDTGYGGGICASGTLEYVRFYLSYDNGVNWEDVGMENFNINDIPGDKPLEFAVTHTIRPRKRFCLFENLLKVRAILSWNDPPPANTPNFPPVWGNVKDANIQVAPFLLFTLGDIFKEISVQIPAGLLTSIDLTQPVKAAAPKSLSAAQLQAQYKGKKVPDHRFLFPEAKKQIAMVAFAGPIGPVASDVFLQELKVNLGDIIGLIDKTDGDTTFEELKCVGLNTNDDTLAAIFTVKLPNGYSGPLCSAGSREYVGFWVDWGDGTGWHSVGTTSVIVHDISSIPAGGLQYAAFMPLNTLTHRQPCEIGPRTARIRAILAWEEVPDNPDFVPTWGNREETRVFIKPGPAIVPGEAKSYIESVAGVPVCHIDQTTGFADGERPFGGVVSITGFIIGAPDLLSPPFKYKVSVVELPGGPPQTVDNSFGITVLEQIGGGIPTSYDITQSVDGDGFYTYREDMNSAGVGWRLVTHRLLAQWITAQPMTGPWQIRLEAKDDLGNPIPAGSITCVADGSTRQNINVLLDEIPPTADVKITGFTRGGGPLQPAVDCATLQQGDVIHGEYKTEDEHFSSLTLSVEPSGPAHGAHPSPSSRSYPIVLTTGETGTWTLDTTGMDPCGYVVRLHVSDRTIVGGDGPWQNEDFVGFCLAAKK